MFQFRMLFFDYVCIVHQTGYFSALGCNSYLADQVFISLQCYYTMYVAVIIVTVIIAHALK